MEKVSHEQAYQQMRTMLARRPERLTPRVRDLHLEPLVAERHAEEVRDALLVVDHQDPDTLRHNGLARHVQIVCPNAVRTL